MKVAEHEGIAGFRLVGCTIGEREMPGRVLRPTVSLEEHVLLGRPWLDVSPTAAHPVLMSVDQVPSLGDSPLVHQVLGHELSLRKIGKPVRRPVRLARSTYRRICARWMRANCVRARWRMPE